MSEAKFIEKLRCLTNKNPNSFNLQDDISRISSGIIVNTDTTIEGVHILGNLNPKYIAYKAMARSVSDVTAKGGNPFAYMLNIILPQGFTKFNTLIDGFKEFTSQYKMDLIGGDTSSHGNNITIIVTVFAKVERNILRSGAKIGDAIYITKNIGSAFFGYEDCKLSNNTTQHAKEYLMPSLSTLVDWSYINASMDISDGLLADVEKMAFASKKCCEIDFNLLPFSLNERQEEQLSFGDDYNIVFTTNSEYNAIKIGRVINGNGLKLVNCPFRIANKGFEHLS